MTALQPTTVLARSTTPLVATVNDDVVMLDPSTSQYFGLDGTGARIWNLLDEPATVADVVGRLLTEFEVDEETCMTEVIQFAGELVAAGLLTSS